MKTTSERAAGEPRLELVREEPRHKRGSSRSRSAASAPPIDRGNERGVVYSTPAVNDGEVDLFVVLCADPRKIVRVNFPAEFMSDDVVDAIEDLAVMMAGRPPLTLA